MTSQTVDFSLVRPHRLHVLVSQLIGLVLSAMLLDGGYGFRICVVAVFVHWLAIAFVSVRRPEDFTAFDAIAVRWGFLPCLVCTAIIGKIISN